MVNRVLSSVLPIALAASAVWAEETSSLNRQLPSWVRFNIEERVREESVIGMGFRPSNDDTYVLQRFRPGLTLLPAPWLKFRFQGQDARVFYKDQKPYAPPFQDRWDLRQAYVEVGYAEKGALMRVGRQEINLGDERLVGSTNWTNAARSFDAVRAAYKWGKYRVDAFASSVVVLKDGDLGERTAGNNLHGLVGGTDNVIPRSTLEAYALWRLSPRVKAELVRRGRSISSRMGCAGWASCRPRSTMGWKWRCSGDRWGRTR